MGMATLEEGQELREFQEHYSMVVHSQASVTLKIIKCTTIGPPRSGKTCFKHLLTGQEWDVEAGTASTDVMEAPEWVQCYSVEDGGTEELWNLVTKEQQQGELIRAVALTTNSTQLTTTPTITHSDVQNPTTPSDVPPTTKPSDATLTTTPSDTKYRTTLSSASPPSTKPQSAQKPATVWQALEALASACSAEDLQDFLKDTVGKVLGKTRLVHFIDTGGHAIYNDMHPVLITSPSVYLVLFSLEDFYQKSDMEQLNYFRSDLIQRPLRSICTFGMKIPQEDHLLVHPEAPTIFIVGTHLDKIPKKYCEETLSILHKMISQEIGNKPYREFVQYDTNCRSFWAVDNTLAGRAQSKEFKKYISTLRMMVQKKSMEMLVKVPLPWMLLKAVMEGKGVRYCKYSELLEEARIRGYVSEHSAIADLDTMLRLFHTLGLFYHKVPRGYKKEDSLVFIDPDCLYSATSDFLMAAKEEIENSQGSSVEGQHQTQAATMEERHKELAGGGRQWMLDPGGIVGKQGIIQRMEDNVDSIKQEVVQIVDSTMARIDQVSTDLVQELEKLCLQLKEIGQQHRKDAMQCPDGLFQKAKRHLFICELIHSLVTSVEAVLDNSGRLGDVHHVRKNVYKAINNVRTRCQSRSINSHDMDQFLAILSDLRVVAQLSDFDRYVVPAALPVVPHSVIFASAGLRGHADSILVTMVSQTIMEVCFLPSGLFCCLITELVTNLGWTVDPLGRTHVAFTHKDLSGKIHVVEHESYIEIKLESEMSLQELAQTCLIVKERIHEGIFCVYRNFYSDPTAGKSAECVRDRLRLSKPTIHYGFYICHSEDSEAVDCFGQLDPKYGTVTCSCCNVTQDPTPQQQIWFGNVDHQKVRVRPVTMDPIPLVECSKALIRKLLEVAPVCRGSEQGYQPDGPKPPSGPNQPLAESENVEASYTEHNTGLEHGDPPQQSTKAEFKLTKCITIRAHGQDNPNPTDKWMQYLHVSSGQAECLSEWPESGHVLLHINIPNHQVYLLPLLITPVNCIYLVTFNLPEEKEEEKALKAIHNTLKDVYVYSSSSYEQLGHNAEVYVFLVGLQTEEKDWSSFAGQLSDTLKTRSYKKLIVHPEGGDPYWTNLGAELSIQDNATLLRRIQYYSCLPTQLVRQSLAFHCELLQRFKDEPLILYEDIEAKCADVVSGIMEGPDLEQFLEVLHRLGFIFYRSFPNFPRSEQVVVLQPQFLRQLFVQVQELSKERKWITTADLFTIASAAYHIRDKQQKWFQVMCASMGLVIERSIKGKSDHVFVMGLEWKCNLPERAHFSVDPLLVTYGPEDMEQMDEYYLLPSPLFPAFINAFFKKLKEQLKKTITMMRNYLHVSVAGSTHIHVVERDSFIEIGLQQFHVGNRISTEQLEKLQQSCQQMRRIVYASAQDATASLKLDSDNLQYGFLCHPENTEARDVFGEFDREDGILICNHCSVPQDPTPQQQIWFSDVELGKFAMQSVNISGQKAKIWKLEAVPTEAPNPPSALSDAVPVVVELQAGLITSEECMRLRDSDCVVGVQCGKPPEVLAKTLKRRGFDTESRFLSVLAELQQDNLITSEECKELRDPNGVLGIQYGKPPEVMARTSKVLKSHGFDTESRFLSDKALRKFEDKYSEMIHNLTSVTLKITKCTTIGPSCSGKTCLKYLLTGQEWNPQEGVARTNVMDALEWVECHSIEEGGVGGLWKLQSIEQQLGELLLASPAHATIKDKEGGVLERQLIHFIDTDGQATYHDIHSAHLTSPSVYLVVFSLKELHQGVKDQLSYLWSNLIQHLLRSIYTCRMKNPQEEHSKVFIIGTHLDQIPKRDCKETLSTLHEVISKEIGNKPYRQFVQYDPKGRSFWAVDNTLAGREHCDKKYISTLRMMVQEKSMEMSVEVPLPWLLLKVAMEYRGEHYCKHSELLDKADKLGFVFASADLDTMLRRLHILGLFYHKVPKGYEEDSLVFIDPDCLYSATLDFFMAAKEEMEDSSKDQHQSQATIMEIEHSQGGSEEGEHQTDAATVEEMVDSQAGSDEGQHQTQAATMEETEDSQGSSEEGEHQTQTSTTEEIEVSQGGNEEGQYQTQAATKEEICFEEDVARKRRQQKQEPKGIVQKKRVVDRIQRNSDSIQHEMEAVLQKIEGLEATEAVLELLHDQLKIEQRNRLFSRESRHAKAGMKANRQVFIVRLVQSLTSSVEAVLHNLKRKGDVRKEVDKAVENIRVQYRSRSINSNDMDQFLSILSDLRIVAQLSDSDSYVVPAALPEVPHSEGIDGEADPILVTVMSHTIMRMCYLPSGLFCCLISELVNNSGWTVHPQGRTCVAFTYRGLSGKVHVMEHESYIEIRLKSKKPLKDLAQICQAVRKRIHDGIVSVHKKFYSDPTADTTFEESLVWGFQCKEHPDDDTHMHIAAFHEDEKSCWKECLLQGCSAVQDATPAQLVWAESRLWEQQLTNDLKLTKCITFEIQDVRVQGKLKSSDKWVQYMQLTPQWTRPLSINKIDWMSPNYGHVLLHIDIPNQQVYPLPLLITPVNCVVLVTFNLPLGKDELEKEMWRRIDNTLEDVYVYSFLKDPELDPALHSQPKVFLVGLQKEEKGGGNMKKLAQSLDHKLRMRSYSGMLVPAKDGSLHWMHMYDGAQPVVRSNAILSAIQEHNYYCWPPRCYRQLLVRYSKLLQLFPNKSFVQYCEVEAKQAELCIPENLSLKHLLKILHYFGLICYRSIADSSLTPSKNVVVLQPQCLCQLFEQVQKLSKRKWNWVSTADLFAAAATPIPRYVQEWFKAVCIDMNLLIELPGGDDVFVMGLEWECNPPNCEHYSVNPLLVTYKSQDSKCESDPISPSLLFPTFVKTFLKELKKDYVTQPNKDKKQTDLQPKVMKRNYWQLRIHMGKGVADIHVVERGSSIEIGLQQFHTKTMNQAEQEQLQELRLFCQGIHKVVSMCTHEWDCFTLSKSSIHYHFTCCHKDEKFTVKPVSVPLVGASKALIRKLETASGSTDQMNNNRIVEDFLRRFRTPFCNDVDAIAIVHELKEERIIADGDLETIKQRNDRLLQNEDLHDILVKKCTKEALMTVCAIMIRYQGNPKMNQLGENMKGELEGSSQDATSI